MYLFSNLEFTSFILTKKTKHSGIHLLSHTVSGIVPSADRVLTVVFETGTGVSPGRIDTAKLTLVCLLSETI